MTSHTITGIFPAGYNVTVATLFNQGTISGPLLSNGIGLYSANSADIINSGKIAPGSLHPAVSLHAGGTLTNQSGGTIRGSYGVVVSGAAGTLVNAGSIGCTGTNGTGVLLEAGGLVTNQSGGTIGGAVGVVASGHAGTVNNAGSIAGVTLSKGGSVTNQSGGTIGGIGVVSWWKMATVYNAGSITRVDLTGGGSVTNAASGLIAGGITGVGVTVVNDGSIAVTAGRGASLNRYSSLTNEASGSIMGIYGVTAGGAGPWNPDTVTNTDSALITGVKIGVYGFCANLFNDATISATEGTGVFMNRGAVTNAASGVITGAGLGVQIQLDGMLENAGTIIGKSGVAVYFTGGGHGSYDHHLLVLEPGAVFSGAVDAGPTTNALELRSGSGTGTLTSFGNFFAKLQAATIGSGASWELTDGRLFDAGGLANDGRIGLESSVLVVASLTGTGSITIDAGSTLIVPGTVAAGETIVFAGIGGALELGNPGKMAGTIVGYVSGDVVTSIPQTVANNDTIGGTVQYGVILGTGGSVTNAASGSITGHSAGVGILGGTGTVVNYGGIGGTSKYGVYLHSGGSVTNAISATISGVVAGVELTPGSSLANSGRIAATGSKGTGVNVIGGGSVTNAASGSITGGRIGVDLPAGGTLTNAGTIVGNGGTAVAFGFAPSLLVLEPGFAFTGAVAGSWFARNNTLELASAASAGVLTGLGAQFMNFGSIVLDAGARWAVAGTVTGSQIVHFAGTSDWLTLSGVLDGLHDGALTNNGLVRVTDITSLALLGSIVNTGTINANATTAGNTDLQIGSPVVTLSGGGTVLLSSNAGNRIVGTAAANLLVNSDNTIAGGGQLGAGTLAFSNRGTVNANASVGLTIDLGSEPGQNLRGGLIEATGAGGLTIASGTIDNAGTMLAANGSKLTFQSGVVNSNNKGGVLSFAVGGGTWEADGNGSTLSVTGGAVTIDRAAIVLSGPGSVFRAGDGSIFTKLEASLGGVAPIGVLELLAGRSFTATHGIADHGMIQLAGGRLTLPRLAVGAGGHVRGFGTMADTRYAIFNAGTIEANGGTLAIATAIDPASSGVFRLDASSVLEIAADQGAGGRMSFLGTGGELVIDAAQKFGLQVGSASYTGPLVQNFGTGDQILLKNVAPAGLTPVYDTTTGILQVSNGSANVASLMFEKTTLGTGSFHIGDDGHGDALLTHS